MINGEVSFWWHDLGGTPPARAPLPGPRDADVCIVGAGYTGLWTALSLIRAQPDLRIVIVEQRFAGFGASGRNGGWLTNSVTGGREQYVARHGRDAAIAQQRALTQTVTEVIETLEAEGIEADVHRGGELEIARNPAQLTRLRQRGVQERTWPHTDVEELDEAAAGQRIGVAGVLGALWHPHCARIHPAKLARGLASAVERAGVTIYENTTATAITSGRVETDRGDVRANVVIRATEGFTANLRGEHRTWLPMNSSMIVTEPLPAAFWAEVGWTGRETLGDAAHVYMYAQRTADDRIAFGGRGVPYRYGSRVDTNGSTQERTVGSLTALLHEFFPGAREVPIAHAWAGVLGAPRDWSATVGFDPATGMGWAGGYVGTGVSATHLAGRTLADLVLHRDTERTHLPWVDHRVRRWEVEPLRWIAVQAIYAAYRLADSQEDRGRTTTSPAARVADLIAGR